MITKLTGPLHDVDLSLGATAYVVVPQPDDPELAVLNLFVQALAPLNGEQCERVVQYLWDRYIPVETT